MDKKDRERALTAMWEGILAAYNATAQEQNDPFTDCRIFAHAALASLESNGFKVVRDVERSRDVGTT